METVIVLRTIVGLIVATAVAFRWTHDMVSGNKPGPTEDHNGLPAINTYYGEHDGFAGPFGLFRLIRKMAASKELAPFMKEGMECRYCMSFSASVLASLPLAIFVPEVFSWGMAIYTGLGIGGAIVFFFCWIQLKYGVGANDF